MRINTIGVYGRTEEEFFSTLRQSGIQEFWDVRARRGMRGSQYRFVNSTYLQKKLAELGIAYRHFRAFAPNESTRELQRKSDTSSGTEKRQRTGLSEAFQKDYVKQLPADEVKQAASGLSSQALEVVLFCVEKEPAACHRSLLAEVLARETQSEIRHL